MPAPQDGDRRPQHGGGGIHARAALEAEDRFLVDGVAAAVQIMRAEVRPEQFLELPDLDAPELARMLLIDLGHLLQPRRARDDLVDRRTQMRIEHRRKFLQNGAGAVVDIVVCEPGGQFGRDWRQRHRRQPFVDQSCRDIGHEWLSEP